MISHPKIQQILDIFPDSDKNHISNLLESNNYNQDIVIDLLLAAASTQTANTTNTTNTNTASTSTPTHNTKRKRPRDSKNNDERYVPIPKTESFELISKY